MIDPDDLRPFKIPNPPKLDRGQKRPGSNPELHAAKAPKNDSTIIRRQQPPASMSAELQAIRDQDPGPSASQVGSSVRSGGTKSPNEKKRINGYFVSFLFFQILDYECRKMLTFHRMFGKLLKHNILK